MHITTSQTTFFSRIYSFCRHPIATVRLSVAKTLCILATDPRLSPRFHWASDALPCHLYQNLLLEERAEIRQLCPDALAAIFNEYESTPTSHFDVLERHMEDWYTLAMTPMGMPMNESLLYRSQGEKKGHNIDKHVLAGDLSLVPVEEVVERRLDAAKALALFRVHASTQVSSKTPLVLGKADKCEGYDIPKSIPRIKQRSSSLPLYRDHPRMGHTVSRLDSHEAWLGRQDGKLQTRRRRIRSYCSRTAH